MLLCRRTLCYPVARHILATGVIHNVPFHQGLASPAINTDIGIVNFRKTALDQFEIRLHVANFSMSLIAIESKTRTAQIVLGASHLAVEGAVFVECRGTTIAAFVPEFVPDIANGTNLVRSHLHGLAGMFCS